MDFLVLSKNAYLNPFQNQLFPHYMELQEQNQIWNTNKKQMYLFWINLQQVQNFYHLSWLSEFHHLAEIDKPHRFD